MEGPSWDEVEDFLQAPRCQPAAAAAKENGLDERAAEALRTAPRWQQRHVMGQGSLATCRDPSAGLMGRGSAIHLPCFDQVEVSGVRKRWTRGLQARKLLRRRPSRPMRRAQSGPELLRSERQELDEFIYANGLNDRAADVLRSADGAVQRRVLEQGSLHATRAPSAACVARVRKLQRLGVRSQSGYPSLDAVESFIYEPRRAS